MFNLAKNSDVLALRKSVDGLIDAMDLDKEGNFGSRIFERLSVRSSDQLSGIDRQLASLKVLLEKIMKILSGKPMEDDDHSEINGISGLLADLVLKMSLVQSHLKSTVSSKENLAMLVMKKKAEIDTEKSRLVEKASALKELSSIYDGTTGFSINYERAQRHFDQEMAKYDEASEKALAEALEAVVKPFLISAVGEEKSGELIAKINACFSPVGEARKSASESIDQIAKVIETQAKSVLAQRVEQDKLLRELQYKLELEQNRVKQKGQEIARSRSHSQGY